MICVTTPVRVAVAKMFKTTNKERRAKVIHMSKFNVCCQQWQEERHQERHQDHDMGGI